MAQLNQKQPKFKVVDESNRFLYALCPFHKDTNPSLCINRVPNRDKPKGYYYCFGCKAFGEISSAEVDELSKNITPITIADNQRPVPDFHMLHYEYFEREFAEDKSKLLAIKWNVSPSVISELGIGWDGCLTPGHRILTKDLEWIPVETLKHGDELLSFEKNVEEGKNRKWVVSKVINNIVVEKPVYRLYLSDGTYITASADHPFLVVRESSSRTKRWRTVEQLHKAVQKSENGITFNRALPVWEKSNSYDGGWLAAIADGEGWLHQRVAQQYAGTWGSNLTLGIAQKNLIVSNQIEEILKKLNFSYGKHKNKKDTFYFCIKNTLDKLRFLGSIRPQRLLDKFDVEKLGRFGVNYSLKPIKIVNSLFLGWKDVCGLSTTSHTYISEGFLSHNSAHTIPMYDLDKIIGIQRQFTAGYKCMVSGSQLGLIVPMTMATGNVLFIPEGASDLACLLNLGFHGIARPNALVGKELVYNWLHRYNPVYDKLIIVVDNDEAGHKGGTELADYLDSERTRTKVVIPGSYKDIRHMTQERGKEYVKDCLEKVIK